MSERRPIGDRVPDLARQYSHERTEHKGLGDLEFIGAGGEQIVFRVTQEKRGKPRTLVLKGDMHLLRSGLLRKLIDRAGHLNPDAQARVETLKRHLQDEKESKELMQQEIERERSFYRHLKVVFGAESVLQPRTVIREVPVTPGVAKEIIHDIGLESLAPQDVINVPTIVRYQRALPEASKAKKEGGTNPDAHSFGLRYVERYNIPLEEYTRLNRMTHTQTEPFDLKLFTKFVHSGTGTLLEKSDADEELASVLRDFVEKIIQFTNRYQLMVDLAGSGNARVYKEDGEWKHLFMDPYADFEWTGARHLVDRLRVVGGVMDRLNATEALNIVNYERMLNGMARYLGLEDRVKLTQDLNDRDWDILSRTALHVFRGSYGWPDRFDDDFDQLSQLEDTVKEAQKEKTTPLKKE